jgi:hypothetical protein
VIQLLMISILLLPISCTGLPVKSHVHRRYDITKDGEKACFNYCAKYKHILGIKRKRTTNNCKIVKHICVNLDDALEVQKKFSEGWILIHESRIL